MSFAASVLVARGLGPSARGTYALAVLIPVLVALLVSFGLNLSAVYYSGQEPYSLGQVASTLLWSGLLVGVTSACLAWLVLRRLSPYFWPEFPTSLLPLSLSSIPFLVWSSWLGHVLLGGEKTTHFGLLGVIQSATLLLAQACSFIWARGRVEIAVAAWLLAQLAAAITAMTMLSRFTSFRVSVDWRFLRDALQYGRAAYVANWIQFLNLRLDQLLVHAWTGSEALGLYGIAVSLTEALWQLPTSVGAVLFARIAATRRHGDTISTAKVSRRTLAATFALVMLMAVGAPWAVPFLFGGEYSDGLPSLYALLPGTLALVVPKVIGGTLYGRGMPRYVTYGAGIALVVTALGDALLIPAWGIVGAGIASSVAYVAFAAYMLVIGDRVLGEHWVQFLVPSVRTATGRRENADSTRC